jgi:hypothetical protein
MNIRRKRSTENIEMSFNDFAMVWIRLLSCVHDFANLNTLSKRKALKAEMAPFPYLTSSGRE